MYLRKFDVRAGWSNYLGHLLIWFGILQPVTIANNMMTLPKICCSTHYFTTSLLWSLLLYPQAEK